jgi:hypothetical protein
VREVVGGVGAVIHAAAESHVDRSIDAARGFLESNVMGTQAVLEAVRAAGTRMLMISTDEVYGEGAHEGGSFTEDAPIAPRSPYAASKAAADLLCGAYRTTYGVDVTVVRGTNAYGPRQIERVIPHVHYLRARGLAAARLRRRHGAPRVPPRPRLGARRGDGPRPGRARRPLQHRGRDRAVEPGARGEDRRARGRVRRPDRVRPRPAGARLPVRGLGRPVAWARLVAGDRLRRRPRRHRHVVPRPTANGCTAPTITTS